MLDLSLGDEEKNREGETIQKPKLGNGNLEVSAIGLGCLGMSFNLGPLSVAHTRFSRSPHLRASTRSGGGSRKKLCCRRLKGSGSDSFPFAPLGKGFLTGKINEDTKSIRRISATPSHALTLRTVKLTRHWLICSANSRKRGR